MKTKHGFWKVFELLDEELVKWGRGWIGTRVELKNINVREKGGVNFIVYNAL